MLNTTRFRPTKLAEAYLALMSCGVIQTALTASSCHASSDCRAIGRLSQNTRSTLFAMTFMGRHDSPILGLLQADRFASSRHAALRGVRGTAATPGGLAASLASRFSVI